MVWPPGIRSQGPSVQIGWPYAIVSAKGKIKSLSFYCIMIILCVFMVEVWGDGGI